MNVTQLCPVPYNQRPSNEYFNLKKSVKFSWIFQTTKEFLTSLMKSILVNYLIVYIIEINSHIKISHINSKLISGLFLFTSALSILYLIQSYLACKYIYNRLMTSSIAYEESGWYDGQTWIKSKEILLQDRLIGIYELQPKIERLQIILTSLLITLGISFMIYILH